MRLALLLVLVAEACAGVGAIKCPKGCECYDSDDFALHCNVDGDKVIINYSPNVYCTIHCTYKPNFNYTKIPSFGTGSLKSIKFNGCALPNSSLAHVVSSFGFTQTHTVWFVSNHNLSNLIRKEHLAGLGSLKTTRLALNNNQFTDLPLDLFAYSGNITWLTLSGNSISNPQDFFRNLTKLETLDFSNNHLTYIPEGMFSHLSSLKSLNLWQNFIHNLTKPVFMNLKELRVLELGSNELTSLPPDVFEHLEKLTNISLLGNNFTSLPSELFSTNKRLHMVQLFSNNANLTQLPSHFLSNLDELIEVKLFQVGLHNIADDVFINSTNIVNIDLSLNYIEKLPPNLLKHQKKLRNLLLKKNKIKSLPGDLFADLNALKVLDLSYNLLDSIDSDVMVSLNNLETLDVSHNRLAVISSDAFPRTNALVYLDMSHNQLDFGPLQKSPIQHLTNLENLNLAHNNITQIDEYLRINMLYLKRLDLSYNHIKRVAYEDVNFLPNNELDVNLTHNRISVVDFGNLVANLAQHSSVLPGQSRQGVRQTHVVHVGHNPFHCDCYISFFIQYLQEINSDRNFEGRQTLTMDVDKARCATSTAGTELAGRPLSSLRPQEMLCDLDDGSLKESVCPEGCQCFARTFDLAAIFNCSNGVVDSFPDITPVLEGLNHTELLLQNNHWNRIRRSADVPEFVTKMYLDGNNLTELSLGDVPKNIEVLSLKNNNLVHLNASIADMVVNGSRLRELWLSGNPLACDCDNRHLLALLQQNRDKVKDYAELKCPEQGPTVQLLNVASLCGVNSGLVSAYCIAVLGIILGFVAGAYYKYNHQIKVYLFARGICLRFIAEEELDKDKHYDAFVAYSHKDEDFVLNKLISPLEKGAFPFKLCVHCRDWIAGDVIQEQIARSVQDSRRTIVVLSPNFIDSEWGKMEFRLAHENAMREHRARVIVVIYGEVDVKKLDNELRAYLTTNTYVKWGDPWFFDKLRYALPHPDRRLVRDVMHASLTKKKGFDDRLELIHPTSPATPPGSNTPPAHQPPNGTVNSAPTPITKFPVFNGYTNGSITMNGLKVNGNAKHSEV